MNLTHKQELECAFNEGYKKGVKEYKLEVKRIINKWFYNHYSYKNHFLYEDDIKELLKRLEE